MELTYCAFPGSALIQPTESPMAKQQRRPLSQGSTLPSRRPRGAAASPIVKRNFDRYKAALKLRDALQELGLSPANLVPNLQVQRERDHRLDNQSLINTSNASPQTLASSICRKQPFPKGNRPERVLRTDAPKSRQIRLSSPRTLLSPPILSNDAGFSGQNTWRNDSLQSGNVSEESRKRREPLAAAPLWQAVSPLL